MEWLTAERHPLANRAIDIGRRIMMPVTGVAAPDVRLQWGLSLWGGAAMTALGPTSDVDLCIAARWAFARPVRTLEAGATRVASMADAWVRGAMRAIAADRTLVFRGLKTRSGSAYAESRGIREIGAVAWSADEARRGQRASGATLRDALRDAAAVALVIEVLDPTPWALDIGIALSWISEKGTGDIAPTNSALWFGRLCGTQDEAERCAAEERFLAAIFPERYEPVQLFVRAWAPSMYRAAMDGEWTKVAKRLAMIAARADDAASFAAFRAITISPQAALASRVMAFLVAIGAGAGPAAAGLEELAARAETCGLAGPAAGGVVELAAWADRSRLAAQSELAAMLLAEKEWIARIDPVLVRILEGGPSLSSGSRS
jgi:hypothetical protein